MCFNTHISSILTARIHIYTFWDEDQEKVALTPTATLSQAQETLATRHPTVSIGKLPPSIPSSLPSHVVSRVASLLCPPTAHSTCPKESWQHYREAKQRYKWPLQTAWTCICIHYLAFLQHTKDCHQAVVVRLWRASQRRHTSLQGSQLPRLRQSEVSNEYTCVVCSREDTGRNRAREEDEYWVNVLSRVGLHSQFPSHNVLCC